MVVAFYWNTVKYAQMQQISTFKFLEVVRQHILGVVGNVMYCFATNSTDFPAVK